jgi:chromosome segregation ATPase
VDDSEVVKVDENEFDKFLSKLKGETKKHFVALLEQLGEANDIIESHEETITNLQGHSHDYADEIADLSIALEEERGLRLALEESHNVDLAQLKKDLEHAQVLTRVLKSEKVDLGVGHARLKEEFELLDKAHKVLKSAHGSLKESHDQLQVKLTTEIATCPPFVLIDNAHATNPCCEHIHLVEENAKLKEQLKKGLVTCIQGEKNLNDLLSNQ